MALYASATYGQKEFCIEWQLRPFPCAIAMFDRLGRSANCRSQYTRALLMNPIGSTAPRRARSH